MLLVKCPRCGNSMKVEPRVGDITKAKKKCVYCGMTFLIHSNAKDSRILKKC